MLIVEFLPTIIVGLALGPLLDRLERRRLMIGSDLMRVAVFCALPFTTSAGAIVALAAVAGLANGFFRPAVYAGVPNLVPEEQLPEANALLQTVENISWMVGPILGGVLTAAFGPERRVLDQRRARSSSRRRWSPGFRRGSSSRRRR